MSKKELYLAPETEVLELRLEGVIAASMDGMLNDFVVDEPDNGTWS